MASLQLLYQWCERFHQADLLEQYDILLEQGMKLKEDAAICLEEYKIPGCKVNFYLNVYRRKAEDTGAERFTVGLWGDCNFERNI